MSLQAGYTVFFLLLYFMLIGELFYFLYRIFSQRERPTPGNLRRHKRRIDKRLTRLGIESLKYDDEWVHALRCMLVREAVRSRENLIYTLIPYLLGLAGLVFLGFSLGWSGSSERWGSFSGLLFLGFCGWTLTYLLGNLVVGLEQQRLHPDDLVALRLSWLLDDRRVSHGKSGLEGARWTAMQVRGIQNSADKHFSGMVRMAGTGVASQVGDWKKVFDEGLNNFLIEILQNNKDHEQQRRQLTEKYIKVILLNRYDLLLAPDSDNIVESPRSAFLLAVIAMMVVLGLVLVAVFLPGWVQLVTTAAVATATIFAKIFRSSSGEKILPVISAMKG